MDDGRTGSSTLVIYGLFHTNAGYSKVVSSGDTLFTLIGFVGLYFVFGLLFLYLVGREIALGPDHEPIVNLTPERERTVGGSREGGAA